MYSIINGDCLEELDRLDPESIDCIVTDPPYELGFMNKSWDRKGISFSPHTVKSPKQGLSGLRLAVDYILPKSP